MDSHTQRWTCSSPADLSQVSSTSKEEKSGLKHGICLQILAPLLNEGILTACRKRSFTRPNYPLDTKTAKEGYTQEVLDVQPLFKSWRAVWASFPIEESGTAMRFIFDIRLPENRCDAPVQEQIVWNTSEIGGLCVVEQQICQLLRGIATVMRMRSHGRAVFNLLGADEYKGGFKDSRGGMFDALEQLLRALSVKE